MKKNTLLTTRRSKMSRRLQGNMGKRAFAGVVICALMIMAVATAKEVHGPMSDEIRLTWYNDSRECQPCWAPCENITYISDRLGLPIPPDDEFHTDTWVMEGNGDNQDFVTNSTARGSIYYGLSWSPNCSKIVFCRTDNSHTSSDDDICTVDGVAHSEPSVAFIYTDGDTETPDWSPNGSKIAMTAESREWQICTIDTDGSNLAQIVDFPDCPSPYICRHPDWSPDGTKIVFDHQRNSPDTHELWIVDVAPGHPLPVAPGQYLTYLCAGETPEWSPSGERVAFTRKTPAGKSDIWTIDPITKAQWQLTTDPTVNYGCPTWSPDGYEMAFHSNRSGNADIWKFSWLPIGGIFAPIDKLGLLTPYIGLASVIVVATAATSIYNKRIKRRKEKQ